MGVAACVNHEQDRRYNEKTTELDRAIRHLNYSEKFASEGSYGLADAALLHAGHILKRIGPDLLIIDPEAKL